VRVIEIPKAPTLPDLEVPDIGPHPGLETNEELKKLNHTMEQVLGQLTRIKGWLVKIESNTKGSGFR
jgi:hypothetical protein